MTKFNDIQTLPAPKPRRSGSFKLALAAVVAVCVAGGMLYWVTRDDDERTRIRSHATKIIEESPVGEVAKYLTPPTPPPTPPASVTSPHTEPGTLAGQRVQGEVPNVYGNSNVSPNTRLGPGQQGGQNVGQNPAGATSDTGLNASGTPGVVPKVREDSVVRPDFVNDAAQWMVARYQAGGKGALSVSALNSRYGTKMPGLSHSGKDAPSGRAAVLRYVFNESMLSALYGLYADDFILALGNAAAAPRKGKPLTPEQTSAMFRAYAGQFSSLGAALQGMASVTNLPARLEKMRRLGQQATDLHTQVREGVFQLDEAREAGNTSAMKAAQLRVDGLNAQYRRLIAERDTTRDQLVSAIRSAAPNARSVDNATLLFMASWLDRRGGDKNGVPQTTITAAQLLEDLASKLQQASGAR